MPLFEPCRLQTGRSRRGGFYAWPRWKPANASQLVPAQSREQQDHGDNDHQPDDWSSANSVRRHERLGLASEAMATHGAPPERQSSASDAGPVKRAAPDVFGYSDILKRSCRPRVGWANCSRPLLPPISPAVNAGRAALAPLAAPARTMVASGQGLANPRVSAGRYKCGSSCDRHSSRGSPPLRHR